jgi:Flp pilus assembly protein TadD
MKYTLPLFLTFLLSACGGAAKKDTGSLSEMSDAQSEAALEKGNPPPPSENGEQPDEREATKDTAGQENDAPVEGVIQVKASSEYKALGAALYAGDESQVIREASKFLAKNQNDLVTLNAMAMHYFNRKKTDLTKLILAKALKKYPNSPAIHNNFGLVYLREKKMVEAISSFRQAQKLDSNHPESAANLGSLLVKTKNYPAAAPLMAKAYRVMDKDIVVANNYAVSLMGTKNFKGAEEVFANAKAGEGNNATVLLNYAILLIEHMKDKKTGLKIVNKIRFLSQDEGILRKAQQLADKAEAIK